MLIFSSSSSPDPDLYDIDLALAISHVEILPPEKVQKLVEERIERFLQQNE